MWVWIRDGRVCISPVGIQGTMFLGEKKKKAEIF
jgi:hypothetical protein